MPKSSRLKERQGHSLAPDWFASQPHPRRFNQGNAQYCAYCGLLVGYSFRGKDYGPDFSQEVTRCPFRALVDTVRKKGKESMTRAQLRLKHVVLLQFSGQTKKVASYIEAAELIARTSTPAVTYVFVDNEGQEVTLTFTGTDASNIPCYLSGHDSGSNTGTLEIPREPPA